MLNCFLPSALVSSVAMAHSYHASIIVSTATRMLMLLMLKSRIVGFDVGRSFRLDGSWRYSGFRHDADPMAQAFERAH